MTFFDDLYNALSSTLVTTPKDEELSVEQAQRSILARTIDGRMIFIGNGGSAAIASHMAADWQKNGHRRTLCFNDSAQLTCLGNDLGYEQVFAAPVAMHVRAVDTLVAISSSGKSPNIIEAVNVADRNGAYIVTLSGFDADNPLRKKGHMNFYVASSNYGIVECAHLAILHGALNEVAR